jgi:hypothetical protein
LKKNSDGRLENIKTTKSFNMKFITSCFTLLFIFMISCCSSSPDKPKTEEATTGQPPPVFENFPTGKVIDKVACKTDTAQSYSLYLPKAYDTKKQYPIIYAFDSHRTGKLPVANYAELAEKYGYIIAGSNNSENGIQWEQTLAIVNTLFSDTRTRLSINPNRIYLLGFSGGARVANAITMMNGSINSVICCGAASPAANIADPRNNYTFFGIAGNADFNYSEMKKYDMLDLAGRRLKHALITFDGKHEWPRIVAMGEAFLWLELNNMRKDPSAKNDNLVLHNLSDESERLYSLEKKNKKYEAYELSRKVINYYEGLGDLSLFYDTYKKLQGNADVDKQLKQNEADWTREEKLKEEYMNNLQKQDYAWWQKDVAAMNQQIKSGKDKNEALIKKRLLSYLSLVCYMQTSGALKQNDMRAATYFDNLYILVDPTNPEAHYFMAEINAKQGNTAVALKALEEAVNKGFNEKGRMQNDSTFAGIKNEAAFVKVLEKIK